MRRYLALLALIGVPALALFYIALVATLWQKAGGRRLLCSVRDRGQGRSVEPEADLGQTDGIMGGR